MWRHYLIGKPFELRSDHHYLKYIFTQPNLNARQRRWLEFLADYEFDISYIKGKENKVADALSRRRHISAMATINFRLRDQILQNLEHDEFYAEISLALIRDPQDSNYSEFSLEEDGFLGYHDRIYVPNNPKLRRLIMGEFHSAPYS